MPLLTETVKVTELPTQIEAEPGVMLQLGLGLTVTVPLAVPTQL